MSYIDDLNDAAERAQTASTTAEAAAAILDDVANGDDQSTVTTGAGEVKTVAKAIQDIIDSLLGGVLSAQVEEITLSEGQTTVTLSEITALVKPLLFVEGAFENDFTLISPTEIELSEGFPDGTRIWILQNVAISDAAASFVQSLGTAMSVDPTILPSTTLGTSSDSTIKMTIDGTDYYIPAYSTAP